MLKKSLFLLIQLTYNTPQKLIKLKNIKSNTFQGLNKLRALDLKNNEIVSVHKYSFKSLTSLDSVCLSNNPIQSFTEPVNFKILFNNC